MRFALLGDHPDGLAMARALVDSGRHTLAIYAGSAVGAEYLRRWRLEPQRLGDLEEVLADPTVAAVIVAGRPGQRAQVVRRSLQSERQVVCVHPLDPRPDSGYEAAMIQAETGFRLFPLLPETLHPGVRQLAELAGALPAAVRPPAQLSEARAAGSNTAITATRPVAPPPSWTPGVRPSLRLVEMERWSTEMVLLDADIAGHRPGFPGWDVLRLLGGEIAELMALSGPEEVDPAEPVLITGQFELGSLFHVTLLPRQTEDRLRVAVLTSQGRAELLFAEGWPGPARLCVVDAGGSEQIVTYEAFDPWTALVDAFEATLTSRAGPRQPGTPHVPPRDPNRDERIAAGKPPPDAPVSEESVLGMAPVLIWQDEVRCLELDEAARRSVQRRRASTLEYQEATEEASFKGTMTLVGCGLLWTSLMLLILSVWVPWLGWFIAPVFGVFIGMQLLRYVVPPKPESQPDAASPAEKQAASPQGSQRS